MKKDELVHLHSLLTLLRAEFERRGVASSQAFADYEGLGVTPMAVYVSKDEHADAVQALADALASAAEAERSGGSAVEDAPHSEQNAPVRS